MRLDRRQMCGTLGRGMDPVEVVEVRALRKRVQEKGSLVRFGSSEIVDGRLRYVIEG